MEAALSAYEDKVLRLVAEHGGRVLERGTVMTGSRHDGEPPTEVQFLEMPSEASLDAYTSDPRRLAMAAERDAAIARTDLFRVQPAAGPAGSAANRPADGSFGRLGAPATTRSIWVLEHVQDWVTVAVGAVLIALAAILLTSGVVDFLDGSSGPISAGAPILLDRVLLVLILVEIVYTVVLSLRAHRLVAQPFIVIGLIAVVRRILSVLTPGSAAVSTAELALLIAMVAVFIAGFVVVSRFEKGDS
jgi:uncharacterized membrane protein (DUF373 family)/uncharacterized protein (DUF1330 family)